MQPIQSAAMKAAISVAATAIILFRMKRSGKPMSWFGLVTPRLVPTLGFMAVYLAWMLGTDLLTHWRGPWHFRAR